MIKPLTSLRFFFSFSVMASHFMFLRDSSSLFLRSIFENILFEGFEICFFYVLSGFILTYRHHQDFETHNNNKKRFYISRIARIYPLHIITFVIAIPLVLNQSSGINLPEIAKFFSNLFLLQSFIPLREYYFTYNSVSWSISNDVFFCFIFPFVIPLISKLIKRQKKLIYIISILLIIPTLMLIIPENKQHDFFYINPFFRCFDYILGVFLFYLYRYIKTKQIHINYTLAEIGSLALLVLFVYLSPMAPEVTRHSAYYWIPMASIVLSFSFQNGKLSNILSKPFFTFLGSLSFSIFLIHALIIRYFNIINGRYMGIENDYIKMGLIITTTLIASYISSTYIERPLGRYVKYKLND